MVFQFQERRPQIRRERLLQARADDLEVTATPEGHEVISSPLPHVGTAHYRRDAAQILKASHAGFKVGRRPQEMVDAIAAGRFRRLHAATAPAARSPAARGS